MGAPKGLDRLVIALGVGQIIGWGSTYFLPGVFSDAFEKATGLSRPMIFAGVTVMLLCSSAMGESAGKLIDRRGARVGLCISHALLATGLVLLSAMQGPALYYMAWMLFGFAMPFGLAGGAQAALVQDRGPDARIAISYLLMVASLSQSIFWPLTAWLDTKISWRLICLIYVGLNLAVVVLLAIVVPPVTSRSSGAISEDDGGILLPEQRGRALPLLILAISGSGFVSWGLELHALEILVAFGITQVTALAIIGLRGPISLASRGVDLVFGRRVGALDIALAAAALMFLSLAAAVVGSGVSGAMAFMVLFAAGTGMMSVARSTLQLALFGPQGFAALAGRIGRPAYFVYAVSPPALGFISERFGMRVSLAIAMLAMATSLYALATLRRMTTAAR